MSQAHLNRLDTWCTDRDSSQFSTYLKITVLLVRNFTKANGLQQQIQTDPHILQISLDIQPHRTHATCLSKYH